MALDVSFTHYILFIVTVAILFGRLGKSDIFHSMNARMIIQAKISSNCPNDVRGEDFLTVYRRRQQQQTPSDGKNSHDSLSKTIFFFTHMK